MSTLVKKVTVLSVCIAGLSATLPSAAVAHASEYRQTAAATQEVVITNSEFLASATTLYQQGKILEKDYRVIRSSMMERWGIKGQTKIVRRRDGKLDIYLNNVLTGLLVGGSIAAVASAIAAIPAVASTLAAGGTSVSAVTGALGAAVGVITSADRGIIITQRPIHGGRSMVVERIREQ